MKRVFALLFLLFLPLLTGCLGGVPLDKYCYVLDVGVERGDTLPYRFVFLLNEDTAAGGEDGGGKGQVSMVSAFPGHCPPSCPLSGPPSWRSPGTLRRRGRSRPSSTAP